MAEIKTCEQYVLAELDRTKKLLDAANDTILDLQKNLDDLQNDMEALKSDCAYSYKEHLNTIELSKEPSYYLHGKVTVNPYSKDMATLEKTVGEEKFKEALTNDEVLEEIGNTKFKPQYYWDYDQAIVIKECPYDWLFSKEYEGKPDIYVITNMTDSSRTCDMHNIDDEEYSLHKEVLYNNLKEEFREKIETYLKNKNKEEED